MLAYDEILNFAIELKKTIRKADDWQHTTTGAGRLREGWEEWQKMVKKVTSTG